MANTRIIIDTLGVLADCAKIHFLTASARGAVYYIAAQYCKAGCPDFTLDYRTASGLHQKLWDVNKIPITNVLNEVLPQLKKLYEDLEAKRLRKSKGVAAYIETRRSNRLKKEAEKQFSDQAENAQTGITAIAPPRREFNAGKIDQFERQRIIKQRQETTGNKLFTDG